MATEARSTTRQQPRFYFRNCTITIYPIGHNVWWGFLGNQTRAKRGSTKCIGNSWSSCRWRHGSHCQSCIGISKAFCCRPMLCLSQFFHIPPDRGEWHVGACAVPPAILSIFSAPRSTLQNGGCTLRGTQCCYLVGWETIRRIKACYAVESTEAEALQKTRPAGCEKPVQYKFSIPVCTTEWGELESSVTNFY